MKTLRFIGMALTAIMLTIGFTACSSDDDDNNGGNGGAGETQVTSNTKLWAAYNPETGKTGYINEKGEWAIPAQYDGADIFSCGRAWVEIGDLNYVIDTNGKIINSTGFDNARDFINNYAIVKKDNLWGVVDKSGNIVIQPTYKRLGYVATNGLLTFSNDGNKWGVINTKNEIVIEPKYDYIRTFNNGVNCAQFDSKWGLINAKGEWVIQPIYKDLYHVSGKELLIFEEQSSGSGPSLRGIMDYNGNIKVQALYKDLQDDETGNGILMAENSNGKYGFIDINGNTVIPFDYDEARPFVEDYTTVSIENGGYDYNYTNHVIDRSGKIIFTLDQKERIEDIRNGLILTYKYEDGKTTFTYRNKDNKIIYTWTE